ncbi:MAG TPA: YfhO family protein, partial [Phycisphaerales bacterium]|nr:YfhO family protein [Phycisphaerales bacterium]
LILLLGIIIPQFFLYFDSLVGNSILLPLDFLQYKHMYIPDPNHVLPRPRDMYTSDLITVFEPNRVYAAQEVRAGRLPLWDLNNYCGAPFIAANHTAVFSPFRIVDYLWPSPYSIAWSQMLRALVAGIGAYLFFRIAMRVAFIPALIGAWLFPHVGFLVFWNGFPLQAVATLLPWMLLATHLAVTRPGAVNGIFLSLATAALLVSGHAANAGHILLASGFFMIYSVIALHGFRNLLKRPALGAVACVLAGWFFGFLISAPQMFPTIEYLRTSYRIAHRIQGDVDTVPQGLCALNQIIWPYFYGNDKTGTGYVTAGNLLESGAEAYIGLFTCVVLAPLGWRAPGLRNLQWFWLILAVFSFSYVLNIPGLNLFFDIPPMNMLRNNRFAFITGWCILSAAVAGLQALCVRPELWRAWLFIPFTLCIAILGWAIVNMFHPNADFVRLIDSLQHGNSLSNKSLIETDVPHMRAWFQRMSFLRVFTALVSLMFWLMLYLRKIRGWIGASVVGCLSLIEVVIVSWGINVQSDPSLYYPPVPFLQSLSEKVTPERVCGVSSYIPNINVMMGLRDIRGYDAADPVRIVEFLRLFEDPRSAKSPSYAVTQDFAPLLGSPLLDMLNVRAIVLRETPPESGIAFACSDDYWALENKNVLPRAWVPESVYTVNDASVRLATLQMPQFAPRKVALVESPVEISLKNCSGTAELTSEHPNSLAFDLNMLTDGLVVISDSWAPGWKAFVDGKSAEVLPANHALRGVQVPKGAKHLELFYRPFSFTLGLWCFAFACGSLVVWYLIGRRSLVKSDALEITQ